MSRIIKHPHYILVAVLFALSATAEERVTVTTNIPKEGVCPQGKTCLERDHYERPKDQILINNLFFYNIQSGAYPCGPPISDFAGILAHHRNLKDNEKNQLMQIAIDHNNCCSESSDSWILYAGHKRQEEAFAQTCQLKQKIDKLTFVNALRSAGFLATCPSLTEYIDTMTEFPDSRLGVLLIIGKAEQKNCDHVQLHAIKKEVEEEREHLWYTRYNIDYRLFEVDF